LVLKLYKQPTKFSFVSKHTKNISLMAKKFIWIDFLVENLKQWVLMVNFSYFYLLL